MTQVKIEKVLVLGAGKVGSTVADMIAEYHRLPVTLADLRAGRGDEGDPLVRRISLDVQSTEDLRAVLRAHSVVINCLPFFLAQRVALEAAACGVHYFDLTEDVAATKAIREISKTATSVLMPQSGLAPGVIGMLGGYLASRFDELYDLRLRVGALTRNATNSLRYNFTWSIDGVINEYCNPCDAIVNGQLVSVQPMEGHETFTLDAEAFEAFNTSGGLGTLCETLQGKVRNLDYKTIRYPGHRDAMNFLLHDLRLIERRDLLRQVLEHAVPHSREDVVILFASASGMRDGRFEQETRVGRVFGAPLRGKDRTAIELTTAAGVVGVFELLRQGQLPAHGFVGQEQAPLGQFLATKVGHYYQGLGVPSSAPAPRHKGEPAHA
ncbi:saccharopine dehydrogenase family protein [Variovorax gossypii]|uniref:Saccharopine dehydrogenase family protein n=1 Tax=Variovorax gossypii TaxID=1679495 RepID=A0A431TD97_9BURK|nr:saccharopine dehydrogenase C-terminal domain-containing protein [Variovorax gossypii]MDP9606258.1 saccharopine dehydrogenase-like NADP-dependent oxidoreductase [Variovorax paradoxus]RTQ30710.1 saccharopine dehydrogenase family protein [Variovorax gossypii]